MTRKLWHMSDKNCTSHHHRNILKPAKIKIVMQHIFCYKTKLPSSSCAVWSYVPYCIIYLKLYSVGKFPMCKNSIKVHEPALFSRQQAEEDQRKSIKFSVAVVSPPLRMMSMTLGGEKNLKWTRLLSHLELNWKLSQENRRRSIGKNLFSIHQMQQKRTMAMAKAPAVDFHLWSSIL